MDCIYIEGLKIDAKIGVFEWEKKIQQVLYLDLKLQLDLSKAGASDDLLDTLNYAVIAEQMQKLALAKHYQLIEHFAEIVAMALMEDQRVQAVKVKVNKPAAIHAAQKIGVEITRKKQAVKS